MWPDVERVLITERQIADRVAELGREIVADSIAGGESGAPELTIVAVLTGAMIFCADLIRQMPIPIRLGLITVSSYPGRSVASQGPQVVDEQLGNLSGRDVLLVDDILDSGQTILRVRDSLRQREAARVRTCVLLRKDRPAARAVPVEFVGFEIPDRFVVGYGLDFDNYYRNLRDIVTLKQEVAGSNG